MFGTLFVGKQSDVFSVNIMEGDQKEEESREPSQQSKSPNSKQMRMTERQAAATKWVPRKKIQTLETSTVRKYSPGREWTKSFISMSAYHMSR